MKTYEVREKRSYTATYRIKAEGEEQAGNLDGEILEKSHSDCVGEELISVEEIDDEDEK